MAKKTRKKVAAKAKKPAKSAARRKPAVAKTRRKGTTAKNARPAAKTGKPVSKKAIARKARPAAASPIVAPQAGAPPRQSFVKKVEQKIEGVVGAVIDTLTDAERLHHKLDPGVPPIPE
jgi:hypothetical protein